jgi:hypothetical protein
MITVDELIVKIVNYPDSYAEKNLSKKDFETCTSMVKYILGPTFITENQSRLVTKILRENQKKLKIFSDEIEEILSLPSWTKNFKQIEQIRKIYTVDKNTDEPGIEVNFTHNGQIRKILTDISKNIENLTQTANGKTYRASLTEKNIVTIIDSLKNFNFVIEDEIQDYYTTIKSWSQDEFFDQFLLTNIEHQNFQKSITADLGIETHIDQNIISDRSIRYQYFTKTPKNPGETLVEYLANRGSPRIWVDNTQHGLSEIVNSLVQLKRLPVLFVFDVWDEEKTLKNLEILSKSLKENSVDDSVGVYFRLPNNEKGKIFNSTIADENYNKPLDEHLKVACILGGKLPKFFLKNPWKPMSVIFFDGYLRHNKTAVYSKCCDLVITYSEKPTLIEYKTL